MNKKYKYKGKIIECEDYIINKLNIALAMNRSNDRYVEVIEEKVICGDIPMIMTIIDTPDYTTAPKTIPLSASNFIYKSDNLNKQKDDGYEK